MHMHMHMHMHIHTRVQVHMADVNVLNFCKETPVYHALFFKKVEVFKYLVEHGADLSLTTTHDFTCTQPFNPLHRTPGPCFFTLCCSTDPHSLYTNLGYTRIPIRVACICWPWFSLPPGSSPVYCCPNTALHKSCSLDLVFTARTRVYICVCVCVRARARVCVCVLVCTPLKASIWLQALGLSSKLNTLLLVCRPWSTPSLLMA